MNDVASRSGTTTRPAPPASPTVYSGTEQIDYRVLSKAKKVDYRTFSKPNKPITEYYRKLNYSQYPYASKTGSVNYPTFRLPYCRFPKILDFRNLFEIRTLRTPSKTITVLLNTVLSIVELFWLPNPLIPYLRVILRFPYTFNYHEKLEGKISM